MRAILIALLAGAAGVVAGASSMAGAAGAIPVRSNGTDVPAQLHRVGNTSSNSSSNTSSNSSAHGSSIVHTHRWSLDSDESGRRRVLHGTTRIERHAPNRRKRPRDRDDD